MQALVGGRLDSYSEASGAFLRATLHRLAEDGIVEAVGGSYRINAGDFADWLVQSAFHSLPVSLSAPQGSTAATCPTITELRHRLRTTLRLAADFDAFCLDFFPEVKRRFADGMDRTTRENMLLELSDLTEVEQSLTGWLRLHTVITR